MPRILVFILLASGAHGLFDLHRRTTASKTNKIGYTSFDEDVCQLRLYGVQEFQGSLKIIREDTDVLRGRDKSLSVVGKFHHFF